MRCVQNVLQADTPQALGKVMCRMSLRLAHTEEVARACEARFSAFKYMEERGFGSQELLHIAATTALSLEGAGFFRDAMRVLLDKQVAAWLEDVTNMAREQLSAWATTAPDGDEEELETEPPIVLSVHRGFHKTLRLVSEKYEASMPL